MPRGHKKAYLPQKKKFPRQRRVQLYYYGLSRTTASQAACVPYSGKSFSCCHKKTDKRKFSSKLSRTSAIQAPRCPGQQRIKLHSVPDNGESGSMLSWTTASRAPHCPGQRRVKLRTVTDSHQVQTISECTITLYNIFLCSILAQ